MSSILIKKIPALFVAITFISFGAPVSHASVTPPTQAIDESYMQQETPVDEGNASDTPFDHYEMSHDGFESGALSAPTPDGKTVVVCVQSPCGNEVNKLEELEQALAEAKDTLKAIRSEQAALESGRNNLLTTKTSYDAEIAAADRVITAKEQEIDRNTTNLEALQDNINLEERRQALATLVSQQAADQRRANLLTNQIKAQNNLINASEKSQKKVKKNSAAWKNLNTKIKAAESKIKTLTNSLSPIQTRISNRVSTIASVIKTINDYVAAQATKATLLSNISRLRSDIAAQNSKKALAAQNNEMLAPRVTANAVALQNVMANKEGLEARVAELETKIATLQAKTNIPSSTELTQKDIDDYRKEVTAWVKGIEAQLLSDYNNEVMSVDPAARAEHEVSEIDKRINYLNENRDTIIKSENDSKIAQEKILQDQISSLNQELESSYNQMYYDTDSGMSYYASDAGNISNQIMNLQMQIEALWFEETAESKIETELMGLHEQRGSLSAELDNLYFSTTSYMTTTVDGGYEEPESSVVANHLRKVSGVIASFFASNSADLVNQIVEDEVNQYNAAQAGAEEQQQQQADDQQAGNPFSDFWKKLKEKVTGTPVDEPSDSPGTGTNGYYEGHEVEEETEASKAEAARLEQDLKNALSAALQADNALADHEFNGRNNMNQEAFATELARLQEAKNAALEEVRAARDALNAHTPELVTKWVEIWVEQQNTRMDRARQRAAEEAANKPLNNGGLHPNGRPKLDTANGLHPNGRPTL